MADWLQKQWESYSIWHLFLLPLSFIFFLLSTVRKCLFSLGLLRSYKLPVPVIVVGNISIGGTGKTPLVIALAAQLKDAGFKPGIISRGYGGSVNEVMEVFADSLPSEVGDEPLLIAKRSSFPVFVSRNRVDAGLALLKANPEVNVIVSDDGLQHYRLQRDIEVAVIDAERGLGNALLMPAGPLRETSRRLNAVDAIVMSNADSQGSIKQGYLPPVFNMQLSGDVFVSLLDGETQQRAPFFKKKPLVAVAGIGRPQRFFDHLGQKSFADHHAFTSQDLLPFAGKTILMTEKDAVKCAPFAKGDAPYDLWMLPVSANIEHELIELVLSNLAVVSKGK